jgi:rhodanese-related sulfurtransferase
MRNPNLSMNYAYMLIRNNQSLLVNAHLFPWIIFDQANSEHEALSRWAFNSQARGCLQFDATGENFSISNAAGPNYDFADCSLTWSDPLGKASTFQNFQQRWGWLTAAAKDGASDPLNAIFASETLDNLLRVPVDGEEAVSRRQESIKCWLEEALAYMPDDTLIFPKTILAPDMKNKQVHVTSIKSLREIWVSSTTTSFARSSENHSTLFPQPVATAPNPQPSTLTPQILSFAQFETLRAHPKTLVVDTRTPPEYMTGHVPSSIFIGLSRFPGGAMFRSWAKDILPTWSKILLICDMENREHLNATLNLIEVLGPDRILGVLEGSQANWKARASEPEESDFFYMPKDLDDEGILSDGGKEGTFVLDVRKDQEWERDGGFKGAKLCRLGELREFVNEVENL